MSDWDEELETDEEREARLELETALENYIRVCNPGDDMRIMVDYIVVASHLGSENPATGYLYDWSRHISPHALEGLARKALRWIVDTTESEIS